MSNFRKADFSEFGEIVTGKTPSSTSPEDFGTEIPFITPSDSFDQKYIHSTQRYLSSEGARKLKGKLLPANSVLVTCIGSAMGKVAMTSTRSITNQQINSIKINRNFDPEYIYYCLKNNYKLLRNAAGGSTALPLLNKTDFERLSCNVHSENDAQQKISTVLSAFDRKIELNDRINTELKAMVKTLYDHWFVQFEFLDANSKPYKTSGGKLAYNPTLKREVPRGWSDAILGQLIKLERGVTYGKDDVLEKSGKDAIGVLRATNVTGNCVDTDDLVYVPVSLVNTSQKITALETIIVMSSGSKEHVGKNGIYYFDEPIGFGAFCAKIVPTEGNGSFVNTFLQSSWFRAYIKNQCLGTNINNLTGDHINQCPIALPTEGLLAKFENETGGIYRKISVNTVENQKLRMLRDWLLPMLMNGQVTVR